MGEETARLRDEIDRTRNDLTRDVDMLADKTNPSRVVQRRVTRARSGLRRGVSGLRERVMGSRGYSREYEGRYGEYGDLYADPYAGDPSGSGPTYAGDVYITGTGTATYPGTYSGESESGSSGVRERLASAGSSASDAAAGAVDSVREGTTHAREQIAHAGERTHQAAQGAVTGVREQTEGNPLAAGLVAFGIGWLVSSLIPPSEAEEQAARRAGQAARERGGPVVDQAKQAAAEVGQNLQGEVQEAAQQLKERAQDAGGTVRDEARSATTS